MPDSASRRGGRTLPQRALVAVAHGSANPRAAAAIDELMPLVARRASERGLHVPDLRVAYLSHARRPCRRSCGRSGRTRRSPCSRCC